MNEYERIVDDLRSALVAQGPEAVDLLRLVAADYAMVCDDANTRLRQCESLLKKGLRAEALRQCEIEPNLLDIIATLDIPEHDLLLRKSHQVGLMPPPDLLMDIASALNEAYAEHQPVENVLRQYRLLSLARAPLKQRVTTLRRIAATDTNNPIWQEDLELFERERQKELQIEVTQAARSADLLLLTSLRAEVNGPDWSVLPPQGLTRFIEQTWVNVRQQQARSELTSLASGLNDAFQQCDLESGRRLLPEWEKYLPLAGIAATDPLADSARPALAWLKEAAVRGVEETEHRAAVAALESGLEQGLPAEQLERLYHSATRHDRDVPAMLISRYQGQIHAREVGRKRRTQLLVAGSVGGLLLAVAGIWLAVSHQNFKGLVAERELALGTLLEEDKLTEANAYLADLKSAHPELAATAGVEALAARLLSLNEAEAARQEQFQASLAAAQARGLAQPDKAALESASKQAKTAAEKSAVLVLEGEIAAAQRKVQTERDEAFLAEAATFTDRVVELDNDEVPLAERTGTLERLASDIAALRARSGLVTDTVRGQLRPIELRVTALQQELKQQQKLSDAEQRLTKAVGNQAAFLAAVEDFKKEFPAHARSASFERTALTPAHWDAVTRWNALCAAWPAETPTPAKGAEFARNLRASLAVCDGFPQTDQLRAALTVVEAINARKSEELTPIVEKLRRLFRDPLMVNLYLVELDDGRRYYATKAPDLDKSEFTLKYLANFEQAERGTAPIPLTKVAYHGKAPQSVLSVTASSLLEQIAKAPPGSEAADAAWDQAFRKLISSVYADERLDPVLKLMLLKRLVDAACQGSPVWATALAQQRQTLEESEVPVVKWMDPADKEADVARRQAEREIKDLAGLVKAVEGVSRETVRLGARPPSYRWIGWLRRSGNRWQLESPSPLDTGDLYAIRREGTAIKLEKCGLAKEGVVELAIPAGVDPTEGQLVFLSSGN